MNRLGETTFGCLTIASLLVVACSKKETPKDPPKDEMCTSFAKRTTDLARTMLKGMGGNKVPASDWKKMDEDERKLREQCMGWSDAAVKCVYNNDETSPGCKQALLEVKDSLSGAPPKAPAGPAFVYEHGFDKAPSSVVLGPDGLVIATLEASVEAVRKDVVWKREGKFRWILPATVPSVGEVLLIAPHEGPIVAVKPESGEELFRIELPIDDKPGASEVRAYAGVKDGDGVVVAAHDNRLFRLDLALCATEKKEPDKKEPDKKQSPKKAPKEARPACVTRIGARPDDASFDGDMVLEAMPDGRFLMRDYTGVYVLSRTGAVEMDWNDWDTTGGARVTSNGSVVAEMDDRVTMVSPKQCGARPFIVPPRVKGGDGCDSCVSAPSGCEVWTWTEKEIESTAPSALPDGSTAVVVDRDSALLDPNGKLLWKTRVGATGPILAHGGKLYVACWGREEEPVGLCVVEPKDGSLALRTPFSTGDESLIYSVDKVWMQRRDDSLLVGLGKRVGVVKLADRP